MKRFYREAAVIDQADGFAIALDGKPVKTPGKLPLVMPSARLAHLVVDEWNAQGDKVDPEVMHYTRLVNTTLDRVEPRMADVGAEVAGFGGSDLLCYRADEPEDLISRQAEVWDPYVIWANGYFNIELKTTSGIMPVKQDEKSLTALKDAVMANSPYEMTVLHALTGGLGSLILALAHTKGHANLDDVWAASQLDEMYQVEQWGEDAEDTEKRNELKNEMVVAAILLECLGLDTNKT